MCSFVSKFEAAMNRLVLPFFMSCLILQPVLRLHQSVSTCFTLNSAHWAPCGAVRKGVCQCLNRPVCFGVACMNSLPATYISLRPRLRFCLDMQIRTMLDTVAVTMLHSTHCSQPGSSWIHGLGLPFTSYSFPCLSYFWCSSAEG